MIIPAFLYHFIIKIEIYKYLETYYKQDNTHAL